MLQTVVGATAGRARVVAGVGGPSTADGVANARIAREAGADALLIFPVGAFLSQPLRTDIVVDYHRAIADAAGLPIILFQLQPMLGGVLYPSEVLDGLLAIPEVVAIKEASFDPLRWLALKAHLDAAPRPITLLTGNDNFIAESFLLGAQGALLGFATLLTAEHVALQAAARAGDVATVQALGRTHPAARGHHLRAARGRLPGADQGGPRDAGLDPQHHRAAAIAGRGRGRGGPHPGGAGGRRLAVTTASPGPAGARSRPDRAYAVWP